jgi:hypothetical protein
MQRVPPLLTSRPSPHPTPIYYYDVMRTTGELGVHPPIRRSPPRLRAGGIRCGWLIAPFNLVTSQVSLDLESGLV